MLKFGGRFWDECCFSVAIIVNENEGMDTNEILWYNQIIIDSIQLQYQVRQI